MADNTGQAPKRADASAQITSSAILGEMVWLYSFSGIHRDWPVGSIHQWLLPAIMHKQYRIYHKGKKPVGFVTWAWLSREGETAYVRNTKSLQPKDWKSGDRLWFLDFIAPFGDTKNMAQDLRQNLFPKDVARFLRAKKGSDTLRIMYVHGAKAVKKAGDRTINPTVELGQD